MTKIIQEGFIEKASRQVLSEILGFDEGNAYFLLLTGQDECLEKEYSYSKRYRLMKSLYEIGAVGKLKPEDKDFFTYFLLPPSFLHLKDIDNKIIEYLEDHYIKNFSNVFTNKFSQVIIKDIKGLLIFLLKHFMKNSAKISANGIEIKKILKEKQDKVFFTSSKTEERRRFGIIDRSFAFEFYDILNIDSYESIGFISNISEKDKKFNKEDYIMRVEKEFDRL